MGWDVFISHASENKLTAAVPLKEALEAAGISVWLDKDEIKLGDPFRSRIDFGLQHCRFGVLLLSPEFFQKPWAQAELDAFFHMEMSAGGKRKLLPIVFGMSIQELYEESPLLASKKCVNWSDGMQSVVGAIAEVVSGTTVKSPTIHSTVEPPAKGNLNHDALVLFLFPDGRIAFLESVELESKENTIEMVLKCDEPTDVALVQDFGRPFQEQIAIAFGTMAFVGVIKEAKLKKLGDCQTATIRIETQENSTANIFEMSYADYSADQLAEMRARRILLDEKIPWEGNCSTSEGIGQAMLEMFVRGQDGFIKVEDSPIPKLYHQFRHDPELFVALAKLASAVFLYLSNVVEQIHLFDVKLDGDKLTVNFSGLRGKKYANADPPRINVNGTLNLTQDQRDNGQQFLD